VLAQGGAVLVLVVVVVVLVLLVVVLVVVVVGWCGWWLVKASLNLRTKMRTRS
jgi:hypothetical protein